MNTDSSIDEALVLSTVADMLVLIDRKERHNKTRATYKFNFRQTTMGTSNAIMYRMTRTKHAPSVTRTAAAYILNWDPPTLTTDSAGTPVIVWSR